MNDNNNSVIQQSVTNFKTLFVIHFIGSFIIIFGGIILLCLFCYFCQRYKTRRNVTRNRRQNIYRYDDDINLSNAPVVVTSSTHTTAAGYVGQTGGYHEAPYPIANTSYPMPHPTTTGHVNPPYPPHTAPYPMHTNTGMPMPQTTQGGGGYPHPQTGFQTTAPYPPANSDPQANPPSYDQVVGNAGTAPYNKQSPYNPHYSG